VDRVPGFKAGAIAAVLDRIKSEKLSRLVGWALRLSEFDFDIVYRRGKANGNADGLSRLPVNKAGVCSDSLDEYLFAIRSRTDVLEEFDLAKEQAQDKLLAPTIECLAEGDPKCIYPDYELFDGILYAKADTRFE